MFNEVLVKRVIQSFHKKGLITVSELKNIKKESIRYEILLSASIFKCYSAKTIRSFSTIPKRNLVTNYSILYAQLVKVRIKMIFSIVFKILLTFSQDNLNQVQESESSDGEYI